MQRFEGRFEGKAAVVTGGASGIGKAIALRLAGEGARVLLADLDAARGEAAREELRSRGLEAEFEPADVTREQDCAGAVARASELWGGLDVLVNSAGIGEGAPVAAMEEASWDRVLGVNLKGTFLCAKNAFPLLLQRGGGCILNLASVAGLIGAPGMGAYAASKGGVLQLTRVLALEGAPHGIRANALCPVWTDTPLVERFLEASGSPALARKRLTASIPMGRFAAVEEVAAAAAFLASDEAAFISGVALPIDGAMLCR